MAALPTIKVVCDSSDSGYMVINESRYDPAIHTKWTEPGSAPESPAGGSGDEPNLGDASAPRVPAPEPPAGDPPSEDKSLRKRRGKR